MMGYGRDESLRKDFLGPAVEANRDRKGFRRGYMVLGNVSMLPLDIDEKASPSAQAADLTREPGLGKGGQQLDHAVPPPVVGQTKTRLKEHLCDAGSAAKIPVDLEGRTGIKKIGECPSTPSVIIHFAIGAFSLLDPGRGEQAS
jgi:hypothetical protein